MEHQHPTCKVKAHRIAIYYECPITTKKHSISVYSPKIENFNNEYYTIEVRCTCGKIHSFKMENDNKEEVKKPVENSYKFTLYGFSWKHPTFGSYVCLLSDIIDNILNYIKNILEAYVTSLSS